VSAHARLTATTGGNGIGWNPNPSTGACGGSSPQGPIFLWDPTSGQTLNLVWQVIAGDGEGNIEAYIDPTGTGQGFPGTPDIPASSITQDGNPSIGYHPFSFVLPTSATCNGPSNTCAFKVRQVGGSAWQSCITFQSQLVVVNGSTGAPPSNKAACVKGSNATFCSYVNNHYVAVPPGTTVGEMDANAQFTYQATLGNLKVFSSGNTDPRCPLLYKLYLCSITFTTSNCPSGPSGTVPITTSGLSYQGACDAMACYCGLNATHQGLYSCSTNVALGGSATLTYSTFSNFTTSDGASYQTDISCYNYGNCNPGWMQQAALAGTACNGQSSSGNGGSAASTVSVSALHVSLVAFATLFLFCVML